MASLEQNNGKAPASIRDLTRYADRLDNAYAKLKQLDRALDFGQTETVEGEITIPDRINIGRPGSPRDILSSSHDSLPILRRISQVNIPKVGELRKGVEEKIVAATEAHMRDVDANFMDGVVSWVFYEKSIEAGEAFLASRKLPDYANVFPAAPTDDMEACPIENQKKDEPSAKDLSEQLQSLLSEYGIMDQQSIVPLIDSSRLTDSHLTFLSDLLRSSDKEPVYKQDALVLFGEGKDTKKKFGQAFIDLHIMLSRLGYPINTIQNARDNGAAYYIDAPLSYIRPVLQIDQSNADEPVEETPHETQAPYAATPNNIGSEVENTVAIKSAIIDPVEPVIAPAAKNNPNVHLADVPVSLPDEESDAQNNALDTLVPNASPENTKPKMPITLAEAEEALFNALVASSTNIINTGALRRAVFPGYSRQHYNNTLKRLIDKLNTISPNTLQLEGAKGTRVLIINPEIRNPVNRDSEINSGTEIDAGDLKVPEAAKDKKQRIKKTKVELIEDYLRGFSADSGQTTKQIARHLYNLAHDQEPTKSQLICVAQYLKSLDDSLRERGESINKERTDEKRFSLKYSIKPVEGSAAGDDGTLKHKSEIVASYLLDFNRDNPASMEQMARRAFGLPPDQQPTKAQMTAISHDLDKVEGVAARHGKRLVREGTGTGRTKAYWIEPVSSNGNAEMRENIDETADLIAEWKRYRTDVPSLKIERDSGHNSREQNPFQLELVNGSIIVNKTEIPINDLERKIVESLLGTADRTLTNKLLAQVVNGYAYGSMADLRTVITKLNLDVYDMTGIKLFTISPLDGLQSTYTLNDCNLLQATKNSF